MFPIILGVTLAFLLVVGVCAGMVVNKFSSYFEEEEPTPIYAPDLLGQTLTEELRQGLIASGFRITVEYDEEDLTPEANKILAQTPEAGTERKVVLGKQYADLKLTLSRGENSIILSDYTVTEYRAVELKLDELGIKYNEEFEYNENIPTGHVIRTSPMAGETVSQGGTITLYISKGEQITYTKIPQLKGVTLEQAKKMLEKYKVNLGEITYVDSTEPKDTVLDQDRIANEQVVSNSVTINLVVSNGSGASE